MKEREGTEREVAYFSPWLPYRLLMLYTQPQAVVRLGCGELKLCMRGEKGVACLVVAMTFPGNTIQRTISDWNRARPGCMLSISLKIARCTIYPGCRDSLHLRCELHKNIYKNKTAAHSSN